MRKVLIICNTVLQIMFATNLKYTEFVDDDVDLIISDHTNNSEVIANNSKNVNAFSNVFYVKSKDFVRSEAAILTNGRWGYITDEIHKTQILKRFIGLTDKYDILFAANPDKFANLLFECLYEKNPNMKYFMYEDGLSAYCVLGETLKLQRHLTVSKLHTVFNQIIRKKYASKYISGLYLFEPELCEWDDGIPLYKMAKIDKNNEKLVHTLNEMFGYSKMNDTYSEIYIFFEESYSVEDTEVNDIEIVENIAEIVGKDNIKVKIHPRNPINRFANLGFATNKNTFIPWELIMLNEDMENKILLSIASGSIANPYIIMGMKTKSIVLMKCAQGDFGKSGNIYNEFLYTKIYKRNPDVFLVPSDIKELDKMIIDLEKDEA